MPLEFDHREEKGDAVQFADGRNTADQVSAANVELSSSSLVREAIGGEVVERHSPGEINAAPLTRLHLRQTGEARLRAQIRRGKVRLGLAAGYFIGLIGLFMSFWFSLGADGVTMQTVDRFFPPFALLTLVISLLAATQKNWMPVQPAIKPVDDLLSIGLLAEAVGLGEPAEILEAEASLAHLLPRLNSSNRLLLTEAQWEYLYGRLKIGNVFLHDTFLISLLETLGRVGDAKAIPYVEELTWSVVRSRKGIRVRDAARECLAAMRVHAPQQLLSDVLLRASSAAAQPNSTLLIPSTEAGETPPEELLRPSVSEQSD